MEPNVVMSVSLIAAFLAGVVALFAPCCITFLLPAYLGSVFKEKKRVMLMTLVFGAGIFVVLMPAVLGVSLISKFVFRYHDVTYYLGGVVMVVVGLLSLFGIKLPMPHFAARQSTDKPDMVSIFTLGVFSGLTSACCAPVLIGILALTFLTPSFWLAMLTGAVYVLGMIAPLLISGYFIDAQKIFNKAVFNKKIGRFVLSNLIAAGIFIPTGFLILYLTFAGKLSMETSRHYAQTIQNTAASIDTAWKKMVFKQKIPGKIEGSKTAQSGDITVMAQPTESGFSLQFDTHTTELDFQIEKIAKLTDDLGTDYGEAVWEGAEPGGHHRQGSVKFTKAVDLRAKRVTLTLEGLDVKFEWERR